MTEGKSAMITALASAAISGITATLTMKRLSQIEQSNDELKSHVVNLGSIVEKYPNAESAAKIIDELRLLSQAVMEIQKQNEFLVRENRSLRSAVDTISKSIELGREEPTSTYLRRPINQITSTPAKNE